MKAPSKTKVKKTAANAVKKSTEVAKSTGSYIAKNPKTVLYVGLGALAVYLGYKVVKGVNAVTDIFVEDEKAGGGAISDISNPSKTPIGATINLIQAQTIAANILSVVDGFGGLSEKGYMVVENALRDKTPNDYQLISNAFGTPKRSPITGEQSFWFLGEKLNLTQWISKELNDDQWIRLKKAAPLLF